MNDIEFLLDISIYIVIFAIGFAIAVLYMTKR